MRCCRSCALCQQEIFWLNKATLGVQGTKVGILKQRNQASITSSIE